MNEPRPGADPAPDSRSGATPGRQSHRRNLRARLLRWYTQNRRDLPWRRTRDPYAIWISEAMLQQTRVETVIPYYHRFLDAFPDVESLARADLDDVLGLWAGLGYYTRARNLKRAAEEVVTRFGSALPDEVDALQSLPGIGRYTAGAIASIAFDRPAPIVDGNVARVFSRVHAIEGLPAERVVRERLWEEAAVLARGARPGDLNQALMELGARICTPRSPRCGECPIAGECVAYATERVHELPTVAARKAPTRERWIAALLTRRGRILAVRRPEDAALGGLWELPGGAVAARRPRLAGMRAHLEAAIGLEITSLTECAHFEYAFTHRDLDVRVLRGEVAPGRIRLRGYEAHRWVSRSGLLTLPSAALGRRAMELALEEP